MGAPKKLRQRRPMSPDQYQMAYQSILSGRIMKNIAAYQWRKRYSQFGDPSVQITVLLSREFAYAAAASAAVDYLYQELHAMMENISIVVTYSKRAFWKCVSD